MLNTLRLLAVRQMQYKQQIMDVKATKNNLLIVLLTHFLNLNRFQQKLLVSVVPLIYHLQLVATMVGLRARVVQD